MDHAELLNTLYVTTPGAYCHLDHDTVRIEREGETLLRVPLHHLAGLVLFGHTMVSPGLLARCAEDGRSLVWLDSRGRFQARVEGPVSGNVLLRRDQMLRSQSPDGCAELARAIVAGKIHNSRQTLLRSARDTAGGAAEALRAAAKVLGELPPSLARAADLDAIRGVEGHAAAVYFGVFGAMLRGDPGLTFEKRTRRPPRDPLNALLSFLYTLLTADCRAALEAVGLDSQVGFLHALRPGRPALALDLVEELRPLLADRLALTLVNRRQLQFDDFEVRPGGAVTMADAARRTVLVAYQERKREEVLHPLLDRRVPWGLVAHVQARLLARAVRGDVAAYEPYRYR